MLSCLSKRKKKHGKKMDDIKELREVVRYAINHNLELKVKSVNVIPLQDEDGNGILHVEITIALTEKKLPSDIMYELVKSATNAIRGAGESRFPVILPHLADKQLLAARS